MSSKNSADTISRTVFFLSLTVLLLLSGAMYGIAVGKYEVWPYQYLTEIRTAVVSLQKFGKITPLNRIRPAPENAPREAFTIYRREDLANGYYAIMGWDESRGHYTVWLFDEEGARQHTWPLDYYRYDADGPLNRSDTPHGLQVMRDGSLIVNFDDGDVMARVDSCGDIIWVKPGVFHHSISRTEDGSMWTWRGENTAYGPYQYLVKFDPENGDTIKEIGLIEDVISGNSLNSMVFSFAQDYSFKHLSANPTQENMAEDFFHPNDLEELSSVLAPLFPDFEAGDLLMSFRTTSLLAVLDPDTLAIKWSGNGPWQKQHDPDFGADGNISVYDNNPNRSGSRILSIDASSGEIYDNLADGDLDFYSHSMGKHQKLPNGNVLIVSPGEGRVLEVNGRGDRVLEFNNVMNARYNSHVENGIWLPQDYFTQFPRCDRH